MVSGVWCAGFSLCGFSCGAWVLSAQASVVVARGQWLWGSGLVAPWPVGSSRTRDQTRLLHWQADS